MAGRSGKTVINININDGADVFDLLGKGLVAARRTVPHTEDEIDVKLGGGLKFDDQEAVAVNAGEGLSIDEHGKLNVEVGDGLAIEDGKIAVTAKYSDVIGTGLKIEDNGKVAVSGGEGLVLNDGNVNVNLGDGLKLDDEGKITLDTGDGVTIEDGKVTGEKLSLGDGLAYDNMGRLIIDNTVPGPVEMFQAVSDIKLNFELGVLTLTKIITTYTVSKNKVGGVVGVAPLSNRLEYEKVTIGGGPYSYGMGVAMHSVPERKADGKMPMFYKV